MTERRDEGESNIERRRRRHLGGRDVVVKKVCHTHHISWGVVRRCHPTALLEGRDDVSGEIFGRRAVFIFIQNLRSLLFCEVGHGVVMQLVVGSSSSGVCLLFYPKPTSDIYSLNKKAILKDREQQNQPDSAKAFTCDAGATSHKEPSGPRRGLAATGHS